MELMIHYIKNETQHEDLQIQKTLGGCNFNNASCHFAGELHLCYIISITQISNSQKKVV